MSKCKMCFCLMMLVMFAVSASALTTTIAITDSAADGWGSSPTMGAGSSSTSAMSWTGWNGDGWSAVSQFYFTIPAELKAAGVVISSASLYLETGYRNVGSSGYAGTYMQLVQYTYDGAGVSVAQAAAIDTPANYTKIGAPVFRPSLTGSSPLSDWGRDFDVTSQLIADIAANWTYMPLAARLTHSDGSFYIPLDQPLGAYSDSLWNYDATGGDPTSRINPKITVEYTVPEPATMLLLGLGALAGLRRRHAA